ncbi:hypothetical protein PMIN03_008191 [Paraphaeosphaeria minitans]
MPSLIFRSIVLILGFCVALQAVSIPVASGNTLALRSDSPASLLPHVEIEARARGAVRTPRKRPGAKRPAKTPAKRPAKPARPATKTRSRSPTSKSATASSIPTVKPLPFTPTPPNKKVFSVCDLPGTHCVFEYDPHDNNGKRDEGNDLVKRASTAPGKPRTFKTNIGPNGLTLISKEYWTGDKLFANPETRTLPHAFVDYTNRNAKAPNAFKVRQTIVKPAWRRRGQYVTEHIVELQTVARFLEAITSTRNPRDPRPVRLNGGVSAAWISQHWNRKDPATVQSRPRPAFNTPSNPADESINDIVFEALGSKNHPEDFVLCEAGINMAKMRLWSNQNPFAPDRIERFARDAAIGATDSANHFTALRTVLAAIDYMRVVDGKFDSEKMKVQQELDPANIRHITNNDPPKDDKGKVVDLSKLWDEYIDKELFRYETKGVEWLDHQLTIAVPLYDREFKLLKVEERKLATQERLARGGNARHQQARNARTTQRNQLIGTVSARRVSVRQATANLKAANLALEALQKRANVSPTQLQQATQNQDTMATRLYEAQRQLLLLERSIIKLDLRYVRQLVTQVRTDVIQLKAYAKKVKQLKSKLEMQKVTQDLRWINI